jgi:nitrogen fixation NifU-like protein
MGTPQLTPSAGAELPSYSAIATEHYRNPRNVGRLDDANGVGIVDDRATENLITIYVRVQAGRIAAARFRTFGCSACIAASSVTTELARGRTMAQAERIDAASVLEALDGLPSGKEHCAALAAQALAAALADYASRSR